MKEVLNSNKKTDNINILLTSAGRRSYLVRYFKEALKGKGKVFVSNSSPYSTAMEAADVSVISPLIYSNEYIPFLLDLCVSNNINAVIPLFDMDVPVLAKNRSVFEEKGIRLIVSDKEFAEICNDKMKACRFLGDAGFKVPLTFDDIDEALSSIGKNELSYPVIIKPRWGAGSIGLCEACDEEELRVLYRKTQKTVMDSYLHYESEADPGRCVMIQQKISGKEYGMDVINDLESNYINTVIRHKIEMRSGETDCATIVEHPGILDLSKKLAGVTKHVANLDADIIEGNDGLYIIDLNARFGGGYPFGHVAGVDLPGAIVKWLRGEKADKNMLEAKPGITALKEISMLCLNLKDGK